MPSIIVPSRRLVQPQGRLALAADFGTPNRAPILAGTPSGEVSQRLPDIYGQVSTVRNQTGVAHRFTASSIAETPVRRLEWPHAPWNAHTGELTVICAFKAETQASRGNKGLMTKFRGVTTGNVGVDERAWLLYIDTQTSGSINYLRFGVSANGSSAGNVQTPASGQNIVPGYYFAVGVYRPSVSLSCFLNGNKNGEITSGVPSAIANIAAPIWAGTQYSITTTATESQYVLDGEISMYAVFPYAVSDEVARSLSGNPWQIFRESPSRIYFDVPSSYSIPTLSTAAIFDITSSSARPGATLTF